MKLSATLKPLMLAALLAGCASPAPPPAPANDPVTLRVNVFRGSSNLPIFMANEKGYFARRGIATEMQFTPNSISQRTGLAAGNFEIAHAAVDNAVAMVEGAKLDVVIVAGGEGGMNEMIVRPEIMKLADIRGHSYVVDAPDTAYALLGRKILKNAGLMDGKDFKLDPLGGSEARTKGLQKPENVATLLNPPWNFLAKDLGGKGLGRTVDLYGPYQANGVFVMRAWGAAHASALERYITAYIEGCRASMDPSQKDLVLMLLQRELKVDARTAQLTYVELTTPGSGLATNCAMDMQGFRNVLSLRAEMEGQWSGTAPAPDKYLDLGYFNRALTYARP